MNISCYVNGFLQSTDPGRLYNKKASSSDTWDKLGKGSKLSLAGELWASMEGTIRIRQGVEETGRKSIGRDDWDWEVFGGQCKNSTVETP